MKIIDKIKKPSDIKDLTQEQLKTLSKQIRGFLVRSISKTGGHLASNLGVVELTLALAYCYDFPNDKLIFDVGHQSYVYKILTGRKDKFDTLRKFEGLCGFPKCNESKYDCFDVGHSSTSVSVGLGFAKARDLLNKDYNVISIIGDGAMTSGLAFEGINNAARSDTNMLVILNDNGMSISKNVGGMTKHLNELRMAKTYQAAKRDVSKILKSLPVVGNDISKSIEKLKDTLRYAFVNGALFEELGFKYFGPIDGHDINALITVLKKIKTIDGPILLHIHTKKGKGYKNAENEPERFHGVSSFDISTGIALKKATGKSYSSVFGDAIIKEATKNKKIVAVTAAMPEGTGLLEFYKKFPDRFFDVGIAEGHAVTFAGAMAKQGLTPVVAIYSTFLQRAFDNIVHDVCLQNLHVVFMIDRAGIVGEDGETHQGIYDIGYLSCIPNMTILAPKNAKELEYMFSYAINFDKPIAIRFRRGNASNVLENYDTPIQFASSETIFEGDDIAIISVGDMMDTSLFVYNKLVTENNLNPTLINLRFIKPIDQNMIKSLSKYKHVFVLENHVSSSGAYAQIAKYNLNIIGFGLPDCYIEHGDTSVIFKKYGLDDLSIYNKIISFVKI